MLSNIMLDAMFSFFKRDAQTYHRLSDDQEFSKDPAFPTGQLVTRKPARILWPYVLPWMTSSAVFAFTSIHFYLSSLEPAYGSFERGWSTDFSRALTSLRIRVLELTLLRQNLLKSISKSTIRFSPVLLSMHQGNVLRTSSGSG